MGISLQEVALAVSHVITTSTSQIDVGNGVGDGVGDGVGGGVGTGVGGGVGTGVGGGVGNLRR